MQPREPKPQPPRLAAVQAEVVQANLQALGLAQAAVMPESVDEALWSYLERTARETGRLPGLSEVSRAMGRPLTTLAGAAERLMRKGKLLRVQRGRYLPVVV